MNTITDYLESLTAKEPAVDWFFPDTDTNISIVQLKDLVYQYASRFESLGLGSQSVVGFALPNSVELVACLYACWLRNIVAVPLRAKSGKYHAYGEFLIGCHRSCRFDLLVFNESTSEENIEDWKEQVGVDIKRIDTINAIDGSNPPTRILSKPSDLAIIQFSSGSTGFPKGVIVTHQMVINQLAHIHMSHGRNTSAVEKGSIASWAPINHDMGLFNGVLYPMYAGRNHLLATPEYYMRNPSRWFKLLSDRKVEMTFTTNSAIATASRSIKRLYKQDDVDLSCLHIYISAEKISAVVLRKARERMAPLGLSENAIHAAYGMAENSLAAAVSMRGGLKIHRFLISDLGEVSFTDENTPDSIELVSSGYPNARHTITIRDDNDESLPEMRIGEVNIESDCLTPGYINQPEITEEKLRDGRFRTGDLGFTHCGELFFYGRKDDLIVFNGRNIVPEDVEETVESLDFVRASSSAILAWENLKTGLMGLHLVVEGSAFDTPEEISEKHRVISQEVAKTHDLVINKIYTSAKGSIEKTSSGKKRRKIVKSRLLSGGLEIYESEESISA